MKTPTKTWTLPQLAKFCVTTLRRTAEDAHHVGTALAIARDKHTVKRKWLVWLKKNAGISRATAYRYIGVAGRMSLKECKDVPLNDIYFVIGEQKQSEQNTLSTAKSSHVENKKEPVQSSHIAEDAGQPKSSHAENNEKLPLPKNDEPDLSWQVEDDVDDADAEFVQAIDAFAGVLGAFLDEGTANFLKPVEKRRIADRLIVAEKLVLQVKKAVLPKAKRRAA